MFRRLEISAATALLAAIVLLVSVAAVSRKAGSPIIWSLEVSTALFVWLVVLAIDIAMQNQRHFGLSLLLDNVSDRTRRWVQLANIAVVMGLLCYLLYYAVINVPLMHKRMLGALQIPKSYIHLAMPVGIALWLRTLGVQFLARWRED
ncbi:TRAP transporter small permease [Psychromarinibacter halotolerans]|uniref:TRAP transporter small permease protein n=1 Tax=Psychromarinibacter halotolerans TaxID=1775175 RepID=A0ABV7GY91_9RHOB|nr:TRAP transporter small permease subunit [Psychromarinibacter halotolerans]MDF0597592.1 TRAP transporter small permease subunit [Psychromarinibacter halotolerans]